MLSAVTASRRWRFQSSPSEVNGPTIPISSATRLDLAPAAVAVGALAQDLVDRVGLGEADHVARAHREAEHRAVAPPPLLDHHVQAVRPDLVGVADPGQAARAGELRDRGHRLTLSGGCGCSSTSTGRWSIPPSCSSPPSSRRGARRGQHDGDGHDRSPAARPRSSRCWTPRCGAGWTRRPRPALAEGALERLPSMPAYPDVPGGAGALRAGGFQLGVLTQSSAEAAEAVRPTSGLRDAFDLVLSAPASGAFKPEDLAYKYGARTAPASPRPGSSPDTGGTSPAPPSPACAPPGSAAPTSPTRSRCPSRTSPAPIWPRSPPSPRADPKRRPI